MFNTSPGRRDFGDEIEIPVTPVLPTEVKKPNTKNYPMTKKPRGKAIIFNILPNDVKLEAHRFYHIFEQLLFEPELHFCLSTRQIKYKLKTIANDLQDRSKEQRDEAIIVMIITHGEGEMIKGIEHPDCASKYGVKDPTDIMPIDEIVDIFGKIEDTIKIFFFTCCRERRF